MTRGDWGKRVVGVEEGDLIKPCCLTPAWGGMRGACKPPKEVTTTFPCTLMV